MIQNSDKKPNNDDSDRNSSRVRKKSKGSPTVVPGVYYPRNGLNQQKSSRPMTRRIINKAGEFNVEKWTCENRFSLFSTWFITLVEARWRWTLMNFFAAFTANWLFFGLIHWVIALIHGDLAYEHLPSYMNETDWTPCVKNIYGFTSTFLFSIEIHTTIAYGKRAITLECPQTIITMCLQCIVSSIFQAFLVGILFAKVTRPKSRTQTMLFSKQMTISLRNDKLCLIFKVGDIRKSRILNIQSSIFMIDLNNMIEDDYNQTELKVDMDGCESTFFLWPVSVIHVIDERSPLYDMSAADLLCNKVEFLAVFEGLIESTGQPMQARTSYTAKDVLWGHRFVPIVNDENEEYFDVDFSKLSETVQVDTPLCSASEYKMFTSMFDYSDDKT